MPGIDRRHIDEVTDDETRQHLLEIAGPRARNIFVAISQSTSGRYDIILKDSAGHRFLLDRTGGARGRRSPDDHVVAVTIEMDQPASAKPDPSVLQPTSLVEELPGSDTVRDDLEFYNSLGPWVRSDVVKNRFSVTRETLKNWRDQHKILGVQFGPKRTFFYPVHQFADGTIIPGLKPVLEELSTRYAPLSIATMLSAPAYSDSEDTLWDVLRSGGLAEMVDWARRTTARLADEAPTGANA